MKIALFGNTYQIEKNRQVSALLRALEAGGCEVSIEPTFLGFLRSHFPTLSAGYQPFTDDCAPDVAVSVGGDGTFLNTAATVGSRCPILGVNTGRLGFLADVNPEQIDQSMEAFLKGDYIVEQHKLIEATVEGRKLTGYPFALNEVALLKHDNSSTIDIATYVDGEFLTGYTADGLVVCTPTGSTGYSLSAGGPVLELRTGTFCLTPVAPHSLSIRPVVISDESVVRLRVKSRSGRYMLALDGRSCSLPAGETVTLRKASFTVGVVKVQHRHYFDMLREKMRWEGGRNA